MDADVLVLGPYEVLRAADCLLYNPEYYEDVENSDIVVGNAAYANTTEQSKKLAEICGVEPWALGRHRIKVPQAPSEPRAWIGDEDAWSVYEKLEKLMREDTQVYFRPNG